MDELVTGVTSAFTGLEDNVVTVGLILIGVAAVIGGIGLFKRMAKSIG